MYKLAIFLKESVAERLTEVNGGVTPQVESNVTYYMWNGDQEFADIIDRKTFENDYEIVIGDSTLALVREKNSE